MFRMIYFEGHVHNDFVLLPRHWCTVQKPQVETKSFPCNQIWSVIPQNYVFSKVSITFNQQVCSCFSKDRQIVVSAAAAAAVVIVVAVVDTAGVGAVADAVVDPLEWGD